MEYPKAQQGLIERLYWLIRLRWLAAGLALFTVLFVTQYLKFQLPVVRLCLIISALFSYNVVLFFLLNRFKEKPPIFIKGLANAQISLDLFSLTALMHFSGGIENPFIFYFIFHMIIASILLSRRASFFQATLAVSLFFAMVFLESAGALRHYYLKDFIAASHYRNPLYISGVSVVFVSTMYIAVYLTTSISKRLRQREQALYETNKQLKEKDRLKSEYVLRVSHDIKEDLAAIQSCLEPVVRGITGELNLKQLDLIQRSHQRTGKLLFFVKALLEITRIKLSSQLQANPFSFNDVLSEAISSISLKAKNKNISINANVENTIGRISGSKDYIQETLVNLLANSVKYTPHNGKIDVKASDKGSRILIEISDNGIGIPKDELPKIFDEFFRASNAKKVERDGTGLGLSIAKQVVEMHRGKIWAESEEGKGSTFRIELPK